MVLQKRMAKEAKEQEKLVKAAQKVGEQLLKFMHATLGV